MTMKIKRFISSIINKMSDSSRSFYDAVYKNNSTSSMTISLLVGRD